MLAILRSLGDSLEVWFACHTEHGKSIVGDQPGFDAALPRTIRAREAESGWLLICRPKPLSLGVGSTSV